MATRKRTGLRPRKATKRMGGKANMRTRKNVLTGGTPKPPPPPGPAPNLKPSKPAESPKKWEPVNTSTGTPNKGASGIVNTLSMGGVASLKQSPDGLKLQRPSQQAAATALTQAAAEKAGNAPNREATKAKVMSHGVSMFGPAGFGPSMLKPAQPVTAEQQKSIKPVTPTTTGPVKVALLPSNKTKAMLTKGLRVNVTGKTFNTRGKEMMFNNKQRKYRPIPPPKPTKSTKPQVAPVEEAFGFGQELNV